jgi:hypothetical protein
MPRVDLQRGTFVSWESNICNVRIRSYSDDGSPHAWTESSDGQRTERPHRVDLHLTAQTPRSDRPGRTIRCSRVVSPRRKPRPYPPVAKRNLHPQEFTGLAANSRRQGISGISPLPICRQEPRHVRNAAAWTISPSRWLLGSIYPPAQTQLFCASASAVFAVGHPGGSAAARVIAHWLDWR